MRYCGKYQVPSPRFRTWNVEFGRCLEFGIRSLEFVFVFVACLLCAPPVPATTVSPKEFTCPLDGTKFTGRVLVSTDKLGGMDSDFCSWPKGTPGLPYEVQVCPKCFYASRNEFFNDALPEAVKKSLETVLKKWRQDHAEAKTADELSGGQRWELAAVSGIVKNDHPPLMGNLWLRAAWAARQAVMSDLHLALGDPMSSFEQLDAMEADLKEEKDPQKIIEETFRLVLGSQRAGDVKRRDAHLKKLEEMKLSQDETSRLAALKKAFAAEALYQERAIASFNVALEKGLANPEERHVYLYLVADMTRRLGKNAEAVTLYKKVIGSEQVRPDIRKMCEFLINWLQGD